MSLLLHFLWLLSVCLFIVQLVFLLCRKNAVAFLVFIVFICQKNTVLDLALMDIWCCVYYCGVCCDLIMQQHTNIAAKHRSYDIIYVICWLKTAL